MPGGWELVGITESGDWSINSDQFLKEKLIGNPALFDFGVTVDYQDSYRTILEVSVFLSRLSNMCYNTFSSHIPIIASFPAVWGGKRSAWLPPFVHESVPFPGKYLRMFVP